MLVRAPTSSVIPIIPRHPGETIGLTGKEAQDLHRHPVCVLGTPQKKAGEGLRIDGDSLMEIHQKRIHQTITLPIGSMYGIYANIWGIWMVHVTIYSIHGSYGLGSSFKPILKSTFNGMIYSRGSFAGQHCCCHRGLILGRNALKLPEISIHL